MKITFVTSTVALLALAPTANAFWRMGCRARSGLARLDPIVSPGTIADHAHAIHGSSGFSATSGTDELFAGDCTTCEAKEDKSAYWTPALYFKDASGKFTLVEQVGGMLAYYLPRPSNTVAQAFPHGFRMIAGDMNQRNFTLPVPDPDQSHWFSMPEQSSQAGLRQKALGFNCMNYAIAPEASLYRHFLPDKAYLDANCKDGVRFELFFPSCWNGIDLDTHDHKSHMAYPDLLQDGNCPPGFPQRLVSLFYETIWNTAAFASQSGEFVLANGDPTGYGYHGDFIMGWDAAFLQKAITQCGDVHDSGVTSACPLFTMQSQDDMNKCHFNPPSIVSSEQYVGPLDSLPGNVPIQAGPAYATRGGANAGAAQANVAPASVPTLSHSAASDTTYLPGAVFNVASTDAAAVSDTSSSSTPSSSPPSSAPPPPAATTPPAGPVLQDGQVIYSTGYSTMGNEVLEVIMIEEFVTVTGGAAVTVTVDVPARHRQRGLRHRHFHPGRG